MRILLTGGGTGGHTFPLIAVSRYLKQLDIPVMARSDSESGEGERRGPPAIDCAEDLVGRGIPIAGQPHEKIELFYLGANTFSREILQQEGIKTKFILSAKLRRYFSPKTILDVFKLPLSFVQALFWLYVIMPDVIFSKGGPGSLMVVVAGWFYHIPIIIHESDTVAGLSNCLAGRFATRIVLAFEKAAQFFPAQKTVVVGNPLRPSLFQGDLEIARQTFQLKPEMPVLLIVGGSQGAKFLNEIIVPILPQLLEKYQVIHVCGEANYEKLSLVAPRPVRNEISNGASNDSQQLKCLNLTNYHLYGFLNEKQMGLAYAAANLVVARSGAGAIFELAALAKPSILIPLPDAAGDHQRINAYEYAKTGAALVLEQSNLREHILLQRISAILDDPTSQAQISEAARAFSRPDAAKIIAQEIIKLTS